MAVLRIGNMSAGCWRRSRAAFAVFGAALALVLAVGACSSHGSKGSTRGSSGFLRLGTISALNSLNPWATTDQLSLDVQSDIYPRLVQYNLSTMTFEPDFATSWRLSNGGRTLTFAIVPHAKWSDGKPLTAQDAAWTINTMVRLRKGAGALWASTVVDIVRATATSPTSLTLTYSKPAANPLANIEQIPILPEHIWGPLAVGAGKGLRAASNEPTAGHPIVSGGPFILVKYTYQQVLVLERNPSYYGQRAHISGFGVELFSNDDALIAAMRAGTIDAATGDPNLPATDVRPLHAAGMKIIAPPSVAYNDLIINTNPAKIGHRELLNPLVREAFEYAIDRNTIDKIAFLGYAQPGSSIVPPATGKWYDSAIKPLPFDLAKANQLLNQAGYHRGSGGIRIADGHPMSYTVYLSTDNGPPGVRTGQIMTADFAKIGVKLNFQPTSDNPLNSTIFADHYRKFDLAMWGWDTFIDPTYILDVVTCSQWYNNSDSGYCSHRYDQLFAAQAAATNPAQRLKIVYQMQQMIFNARPYIVLQYLDALEGWSPKWCHVTVSPDGWMTQLSSDAQTSIRECHA
jgi:peptide/nickel transport system substrate-binding protein